MNIPNDHVQKIKKLPSHVINQIAAGEVIERPASVLKELVENSLDAHAQNIEIIFETGGTTTLSILDDGHGIDKVDLELALTQHATSKISSVEQLDQLYSFGFRGEALASISSVSRFELCSRTAAAEWGYKITVGQFSNILPETVPMAMPKGTHVHVRDLFYNIPARRKFLASLKTETLRLQDMFNRLVLSEYEVSFTLKKGQQLLHHLPKISNPQDQGERIEKIIGKPFLQQAYRLENKHELMQIEGWIAPQTGIRNGSKIQYFFLNKRIIKDKIIHHAIKQAWLDAGQTQAPAFILHLHLAPNAFDINVHPTKYEVRFNDARLIHHFLYKTICTTLKGDFYTTALPTPLPFVLGSSSPSAPSPNLPMKALTNTPSLQGHANLGQTALAYGSEQTFLLNLQSIAYEEFLNAKTKLLLLPQKMALHAQVAVHWDVIKQQFNALGFECSLLGELQFLIRAAPLGLNWDHFTEHCPDYLTQLLKINQDQLSRKLFWPSVSVHPLNDLETAQRYINQYRHRNDLIKCCSHAAFHEAFWPS